MNKNLTPIILIILAIGIYFTFTRVKFDEIKSIRAVNQVYVQALENSEKLIKVRDEVVGNYNKLDIADRENLEKIIPDNIDNVRLIIDTNSVAARHGIILKNIKTITTDDKASTNSNTPTPPASQNNSAVTPVVGSYNTMTLKFTVASSYDAFKAFMTDLESSLRIMEVSKIILKVGESSIYTHDVEIKTYWLKQ